MRPETLKLLEDVRAAAVCILGHTRDKTLDSYRTDDLLRPAVERYFEIIGEALARMRKTNPQALSEVPDHAQIIAFRNVLIHGYDAIDHTRVWDAIQNSLPRLLARVETLLRQTPPTP
jgi:uncharacterized protein with HEPN domain